MKKYSIPKISIPNIHSNGEILSIHSSLSSTLANGITKVMKEKRRPKKDRVEAKSKKLNDDIINR